MDPKTLRNQLAQKGAEVDAFKANWAGKEAQMPKEEIDKGLGLMAQFDEISTKLDLATRMQAGHEFLNAPTAPQAALRQAATGEGEEVVDLPAWRSFKIATPYGEKEFRFHVPERVGRIEKAYSKAFEAFLHTGYADLGPQDRKTLTEGTDNAGGFLVPPDYQTELLKKTTMQAVVRRLARVAQTSRDIAYWPRINYTDDDIWTSGVRLTWTGEIPSSATTHRVTEPVFGLVGIPIFTAMASLPLSNNLIEDSAFDVIGISQDLLSEAFSLGEDNVFLNGNGANQPTGLLTEIVSTNGTTSPQYVVSGVSAAISTSGDAWNGKRLIDLYYALPAQYAGSASWLMASSTLAAIENLVDGNARPVVQPLMNAGLTTGEPVSMKGRPVYRDEFMPAIAANSYSIAFGDFRGYTILDRVGLSIQRLNEIYAETNITLLLAKKRVGGYCTEPYKIKVMKCATS